MLQRRERGCKQINGSLFTMEIGGLAYSRANTGLYRKKSTGQERKACDLQDGKFPPDRTVSAKAWRLKCT